MVTEDPARRILAGRLVTSLGYEVRNAADGQEALTILDGTVVSAVLLDIETPLPTALELVQALRSRPRAGGETPILAVVGQLTTEDREHALATGVRAFLFRPLGWHLWNRWCWRSCR